MKQNNFQSREAFERSKEYLVCPVDQGELSFDLPNFDQVREGNLECLSCGNQYPVLDGIPRFGKSNGYEWPVDFCNDDLGKCIAETVRDNNLTLRKIVSLPTFFNLKGYGRKESIDSVFKVVGDVVQLADIDDEKAAEMMQAATQARYELEIYRGTFKIPKSNLDEVLKIYNNGLVVEGACASGECLDDVCDYLSADFSIGVDLAGALLNDAVNSNGSDKKLYVQGDICKLPIRSDISGLYILNNVFDRVVNPMKAANEANRIVSNSNGVFVLSNCDPLQYGYQTDDCKEVLFVQEQNWLSLEDGLSIAGFSEVSRVKGIGADGWKLSTVAYGNENLPYLSLVGGRFEK